MYVHAVPTDVFQALADPTRRRIIDCLRGQERTVGDIVDRVSVAQSGVSRHLRLLGEAGFVQVRTDGARHCYSLRPEPFAELDTWVAGYRASWTAALDRFGAALEQAVPAAIPAPTASQGRTPTTAAATTTSRSTHVR